MEREIVKRRGQGGKARALAPLKYIPTHSHCTQTSSGRAPNLYRQARGGVERTAPMLFGQETGNGGESIAFAWTAGVSAASDSEDAGRVEDVHGRVSEVVCDGPDRVVAVLEHSPTRRRVCGPVGHCRGGAHISRPSLHPPACTHTQRQHSGRPMRQRRGTAEHT